MVINISIHPKIGFGFYSTVFRVGGEAYKLFKRASPGNSHRKIWTDEGRRHTFKSECAAYERVEKHDLLRNHIARFRGALQIEDVTYHKRSLGSMYLLDCCYRLEDLSSYGEPPKLREIRDLEHIKIAVESFKTLGVHVHDSSVFQPNDKHRFKFIDFSLAHQTQEIEPL